MVSNKLILNKKEISDVLDQNCKSLLNIFDDKFGIVNAILERHELNKYNLYMYQCLSANTINLFDVNRDVSSGGLGVNEKKDIAIISCLAEALERYCMSYIPNDDIVVEYKKNLNKKFVFEEFSIYSEEQYKKNSNFLNPNKDKIEWTKIYSCENNKKYMYWPASLIYLPFDINKPVAETTSTGMAADFDLENCLKSGLFELIERDALMINFMQRLNPPEINIDSICGMNKDLIEKIKVEYNIKIYKLYSDINIPIYLSIIYKNKGRKAHYGIGACANMNSDFAINKSLKECLFTYFYSQNIIRDKVSNPKKIEKLYEHFLFYQGKNLEKLFFDSKQIKYKKEIVEFNEVILSLKKSNIDVYYKELTTEDIKDTKIKVVKVIAPGLIDLNKTHIYPRLGAERFFIVPKKLGLEYSNKLVEMPHPFP